LQTAPVGLASRWNAGGAPGRMLSTVWCAVSETDIVLTA